MADEGIKLTDDERERLLCDVGCTEGHSRYCAAAMPDVYRVQMDAGDLVERVESIVAARLQALTAERDEAREIGGWDEWACKQNQELFRQAQADLDAARAELAAANNRIAELEQAGTQSFVLGELVPDPLLTEHEAQVTDALRSRLAKSEATNAALSARLERVRALAEKWDGEGIHSDDPLMALCDHEARAVIAQLRAALGEDA